MEGEGQRGASWRVMSTRLVSCQVESETHASTKKSPELVNTVHVKPHDGTSVVTTARLGLCQTSIVGNMPAFTSAVAKSHQRVLT